VDKLGGMGGSGWLDLKSSWSYPFRFWCKLSIMTTALPSIFYTIFVGPISYIMLLTKSDFLKYKQCAPYAMFFKNNPSILVDQESDPSVQSLIDQGAEVEEWGQKLCPDGVRVRAYNQKVLYKTARCARPMG